MANNNLNGGDDLDFDFDEFDFDDPSAVDSERGDARSPRARLTRFASTLGREAVSKEARRQYLRDALPQNYHSTLNAGESLSDFGSDLYNNAVMEQWEKTRNPIKRALRVEAKTLRKFKLGKLADWAEEREEWGNSYNAEEAAVQSQMDMFRGSLGDMLKNSQNPQQDKRAAIMQMDGDEKLKEGEQNYQDVTVKQNSANSHLLRQLLDNSNRALDYQDQVNFAYQKKTIELGVRSLIAQRKNLEQNSLLRAEIKDGLQAIIKNTGLPEYVKITGQENAKRILRDKLVNKASDWAGNRLSGTLRAFGEQTRRNLASMGMRIRDGANAYADNKEMLNESGAGSDIMMGLLAGLIRSQASKAGGKYIREWIKKHPEYTKGLDFTEAVLANGGSLLEMAMDGNSGNRRIDGLLERGGYSGLSQRMRSRIAETKASKLDEASYMDNKVKRSITDVIPGWLGRIWQVLTAQHKGVNVDKVPTESWDFKFNRFRTDKDLQTEFDSETLDDNRVKNYNDGIDNWINNLDPNHTFTPETRSVIRHWLITNHAKGRPSFPVSLYRGENLPPNTSREVRRELTDKVPTLAGFDPMRVDMLMDEGAALQIKVMKQNPDYRRVAKKLGNADAQARTRMPVNNERLAQMTERYGHNALVNSGLGKYDKDGNISLDSDNLVNMVSGGGNRNYTQRNNVDFLGNVTPIDGVDQNARPGDDDRSPIIRTGSGLGQKDYDTWTKDLLRGLNGPRLPGFARGGFTGGSPDNISGVTHGEETVIDSQTTQENKGILAGIMKLGAPLIKNGKINRLYYKYLGFKSPADVDAINKIKNLSSQDIKNHLSETGKKTKNALLDFRNKHLHDDGYLSSYGPTPAFMGPVRTGGLIHGARDLRSNLTNPDYIQGKATDIYNKARTFNPNEFADDLSEYKRRAKAALKNANQSKSTDFNSTSEAIERAIKEGHLEDQEAVSLYMRGQNSPFITRNDFLTGRFRNRTSGKVISKPSDIMDDIILAGDGGYVDTIATMFELMDGVYDSRGKQVRLPGLEDGYRKYIKRTSKLYSAIQNTTIGRALVSLKEKVWDDQPEDVCIIVNGELECVLKATGFLIGQYIDAETHDVLKSHNDIQGEVQNLQGDTLLSLEDLSLGIFNKEGKRLKISKIKHLRNKAVTKIENFVKTKYGQLRNKALDKALSWVEKKQGKDVYVMRWVKGEGRQLKKAFSMADLNDGMLIDVASGKTIKKLSEITGKVYSKKSKSVVVLEDEIQHGFFDDNGKPYKDTKNMSVDERLNAQIDRFTDYATNTGKKVWNSLKDGWQAFKIGANASGLVRNPNDVVDVYIQGESKPVLTVAEFLNGSYAIEKGTRFITIYNHKPIDGPVYLLDNDQYVPYLDVSQMQKGLVDKDGNKLKTQLPKPQKDTLASRFTSSVGRGIGSILNKLKRNDEDIADVAVYRDGQLHTVLTADGFRRGAYYDSATGKKLRSHHDITSDVVLANGDVKVTKDELDQGMFNRFGTPLSMDRKAKAKGFFGSIGSKIGGKLKAMREGSWQWLQAKKAEREKNKKGDVTVNVDAGGKEKKGFIGKLLGGLGTLFGGMFLKMMTRFGKMFKALRTAMLLSKGGGFLSGLFGGGKGARGGGGGKLGLITKLVGAGLVGYGGYKAYNSMGGEDEDGFDEDDKKLLTEQKKQEEEPSIIGDAVNTAMNGGVGPMAAMYAGSQAIPWLAGKLFGKKAEAGVGSLYPQQDGMLARSVKNVGSLFGLGGGSAAAGAATGLGGAEAAAAGTAGAAAASRGSWGSRIAGWGKNAISGAGKALGWAASPTAAAGRLGTAARIAGTLGRGALMAGRLLSGPVGWATIAAGYIGAKLWSRYEGKDSPLLRFRMKQYGFNFSDEEYSAKLLDAENIVSKHVTVSGDGIPSIKTDLPEDQIFQLFEVNTQDPKAQEHVQRFIAWWIKRFKPVYLSYVKQTHAILKKTDISNIDEELGKKDKLKLLKGVHFINAQNNPYMVAASPFAKPEEVEMTQADVEKGYNKCLSVINKMPDEAVTVATTKDATEAGEPTKETPKDGSWLDRSVSGIKELGKETLRVTGMLAEKTGDVFTSWFDKASENIKGLWGGVKDWFNGATESLSNSISTAWSGLTEKLSQFKDAVANSAVGQAAGNAVNAAVDGHMAIGNAIGGMWDSAKESMGMSSDMGAGESAMVAAAREGGITSPTEMAALLATTAHESGNFRQTSENLKYRAAQLMKTWPNRFPNMEIANKVASGGPQAIAEAVYGGRMGNTAPGDGYKYRGRGYIQLTGKANYQAFAKASGIDVVSNPDLVSRPDVAAKSAVWYWKNRGGLRQAAQRGDMKTVTKLVNGGYNGLSDRQSKYSKYMEKVKSGKLSVAASGAANPALAGAAMLGGMTNIGSMGAGSKPNTGAITTGAGMLGGAATIGGGGKSPASTTGTKAEMKVPSDLSSKIPSVHEGSVNGSDPSATQPNKQTTGGYPQPATNGMNVKVPPWMEVALSELRLGVGENKNLARANQYFSDLGSPNLRANKDSWCAAFVSWCLKESGTSYNTQTPFGAKAGYANWGKKLSKDNIPYGAIVVVGPSHVFFSAGVEGNRVKGLGGNQGKPGEVKYSYFPLKDVISVAWPTGAAQPGSAKEYVPGAAAASQDVYQTNQQGSFGGTDANASGLPDPSSARPSTGGGTNARQERGNRAVDQQDESVYSLQLQEARLQTGLLTEIRDAITGQRGDTTTGINRTVDAIGGLNGAQQAQVELISGAVGALIGTLKNFNQGNKSNTSLSDQFPISARK